MRPGPCKSPRSKRMPHNPRVADTELPVDPPENDRRSDVQIRTFLIADVRGYTLFTQERGDEAAAKLAAKFADIAREIVETRGGTLLELRGDEALCVFASTREAIRAALDLQQRFVEETPSNPSCLSPLASAWMPVRRFRYRAGTAEERSISPPGSAARRAPARSSPPER
jgi:class 3 adenylate cyclase